MRYRRQRSIFLRFMLPVLVVLLFASVFGLVWLRSQITSVEYRIGRMQGQKLEAMKEEKVLVARMASLLSLKQVEARNLELQFPDRQKVVYVRREKGGVPYTASLTRE